MSMAERGRCNEVLKKTAAIVFALYAGVLIMGYYFFAQHTQAPITLNIGRDFANNMLSNGVALKVAASLGICCNLQVTCPLITFALRDLALQLSSFELTQENKHKSAVLMTLTSLAISLILRNSFASVCSLMGSIAITTNSIILPVAFFHMVYQGEISSTKKSFHVLIVVFACACALGGVVSNSCTIAENTEDMQSFICKLLTGNI